MTARERWLRTLSFVVQWDGEGWWGYCPQTHQLDHNNHEKASAALQSIKGMVIR